MNVAESIIEIVSDILDVTIGEVSIETSQMNFEAWDSLATIQIINSVSSEFDMEISINEMEAFTSVKEIIDFVLVKTQR